MFTNTEITLPCDFAGYFSFFNFLLFPQNVKIDTLELKAHVMF